MHRCALLVIRDGETCRERMHYMEFCIHFLVYIAIATNTGAISLRHVLLTAFIERLQKCCRTVSLSS